MNPNIKILGMQWYGKTAMFNLVRGANADENEPKIQNYVSGVARMVEYWTLDGYDVDYEWNDPSENEIGNLIPEAPRILHLIREKLNDLSKRLHRPLYVPISPATTSYLASEATERARQGNPSAAQYPVTKSVNWVNVQTYSGG